MTSLSLFPPGRSTAVGRWEIDPAHSSVEFAVRHLMIGTVRGRFTGVRGTVTVGDDGATVVESVIEVASLTTGDAGRDAHLRSPDFLDAARFPAMRFLGRVVAGGTHATFGLPGQLTVHGIRREVELAVVAHGRVEDQAGQVRAGFSARTTINRRGFGLTWNQILESGGVLVGDQVKIAIEVELVRRQGEALPDLAS